MNRIVEAIADKTAIVVGIDGSPNADRALGWAIEEAKIHSAAIRIVTAWQVPLAGYSSSGATPPASTSLPETVRRYAEKIAERAATKARAEARVPVETRVVEGAAAEALIEAAKADDRLVVGGRSKPALPLVVATSVSLQCALHAHCPTTIVR
jgi:nucleotide-binding universal stress UspA family protein